MRPHRARLAAGALSLAFLVTCSAPERHPRATRQYRAVLHPAVLRPVIVSRAVWRADEGAVREKPVYDSGVRAVFIHHTDNPNDYDCKRDVPAMLRAMEQEHIAQGWDDIGYNFVVDRCGGIYEGRAGGVDRAVQGAHTEGFNIGTVGIAALGHFDAGQPLPQPMLQSIAEIAAWKLAPDVDAAGKVRLVSSNDLSRFRRGTAVKVNAISGHRDVFQTDCPGAALYAALPWIRRTAEELRRSATWAGNRPPPVPVRTPHPAPPAPAPPR
ncbi:N-acetylmuramoyl-L-alanine amidase [Actinacidiphila rubida]|nr:N-acetylmuramoyl-L-alanine amidase [Actinacidiphila rubida]